MIAGRKKGEPIGSRVECFLANESIRFLNADAKAKDQTFLGVLPLRLLRRCHDHSEMDLKQTPC